MHAVNEVTCHNKHKVQIRSMDRTTRSDSYVWDLLYGSWEAKMKKRNLNIATNDNVSVKSIRPFSRTAIVFHSSGV